mgnify:CR=1 FL=1
MNVSVMRHELKYYIARPDAFWIAHQLSHLLSPDPHTKGQGVYHIRSLYFDDTFSSAFKEKLDGVMERDKFRIRFYNGDDSYIALEKKSKWGDLTNKQSVRVDRNFCDRVLAGEVDRLLDSDSPLIREFFLRIRTKALSPTVIVDYIRAPFFHPVSDLRITLDSDLQTGIWRQDMFSSTVTPVPVLQDDRVILEIKFNHIMPEHIDQVLRNVPRERMAISKFVLCSEML